MHVNWYGCKCSIYHIIWSTGNKFTICKYYVTIFAFCISFSSLCQQSYRGIVVDMRCVFEGFTPLWRKTFLAPVNIVRRAQNANTNTTTALCTGSVIFCTVLSKIVTRCLLVADFPLKNRVRISWRVLELLHANRRTDMIKLTPIDANPSCDLANKISYNLDIVLK